MGEPAKRKATYADLCAVPAQHIAEIVAGELVTQPRPAMPHATVASKLGMDIGTPFDRGRGGPGGWIILYEPELHLSEDVLVPDLAGWRKTRMPAVPNVAALELADWACEVLSPSTASIDRIKKLPIYARERVLHVWLIDPLLRTLEVFRLDGTGYRWVAAHGGEEVVRVEPFDAIELELGTLWL